MSKRAEVKFEVSKEKSLEDKIALLEEENIRLRNELLDLYRTMRYQDSHPRGLRDIYFEWARDGSRGGCPG